MGTLNSIPYNVTEGLAEAARRDPYRPAIFVPKKHPKGKKTPYEVYSFQQLNQLCDSRAHILRRSGVQPGQRVLMMVPPGLDLIAVTFALLRLGAVPVLIDPGMGRTSFIKCVREAQPAAFIGIPPAHIYRLIARTAFASVKRAFSVGGNLPGTICLDETGTDFGPYAGVETTTESEAAITFTSGSTGIPKGVVYLHGMFRAMIELLRSEIGIRPGEIDLPGLYILALLNPALGVTTVLPEMDVTKPARVDARLLVEAIQTFGITTSFGSPTIWKKVYAYCRTQEITLPTVRRVLMAGSSVSPQLVRGFKDCLPHGEVFTPYGATEALPLTNMSGEEIINETAALAEEGAGVCVGRPLKGIMLRIIPIRDDAIPVWEDGLSLPAGEVGEIAVKGDVVTREYLRRPDQNALAKITDGDGIWHRMGDLGRLDEKGRLWVCGRKAHRVETRAGILLPDPCEEIFNRHPRVARSALVGIGRRGDQTPVIVIEPRTGEMPLTRAAQDSFANELRALGRNYPHTRPIQTFLFRPDFPVDVRHNVKIQRERLAVWAETQLKPDFD